MTNPVQVDCLPPSLGRGPIGKFLERNSNTSETARNIVVILAVMTGGAWTAYSFTALKEAERAELELALVDSRLSISISGEQVSLPNEDGYGILTTVTIKNVGVKPVTLDYRSGDPEDPNESQKESGSIPIGSTRQGKTEEKKEYIPPAAAYRVTFSENGAVETFFDKKRGGRIVFWDSIPGHPLTVPAKDSHKAVVTWETIRAGETRSVPFLFKVYKTGTYLVAYRVSAPRTTDEARFYEKKVGKPISSAVWSARTYVFISDEMQRPKSTLKAEAVDKAGQ